MLKVYWLDNKRALFSFNANYSKTSCQNNNMRLSTILFTQSNIANFINKFLNFVKAKLNKLFVTVLRRQQRVVLFLNYVKNFKLNLFILFKILSSLYFKDIIFFKLFFDSKDNTLFDFINFNKFSKVIKLLNTFQNLLFSNLDLTLQKYSKLRLY